MGGSQRLQQYQHHYCSVCLTGLLGGRWHRYQQSQQPADKKTVIFYLLFWVVLLFSTFLLYFWVILDNDAYKLNRAFVQYSQSNKGTFFHWYTLFLALTAVSVAYVLFLTLLTLCHAGEGQQLHFHLLHKIVVLLVLIFGVVTLYYLSVVHPEGWRLLVLSFQMHVIAIHFALLLALILLSWFASCSMYSNHGKVLQFGPFVLYLLVLIFVIALPRLAHCPCVREGDVQRPSVMALGGASSADVIVSSDNIPLLMHGGRSLRYWTDVRDVFPLRADNPPCLFNSSELLQLRTGEWFLQSDPFGTVYSLSAASRAQIANMTAGSLAELAALARAKNLSVVPHIHHSSCGNLSLKAACEHVRDVLKNAGLQQNQVLWRYNNVIDVTGVFTVVSDGLHNVTQSHVIYAHYSALTIQKLRDLVAQEHRLIIYPVNSKWVYSLYWCLGITTIGSNLANLSYQSPMYKMTQQTLTTTIIVVDVSAVIIIVLLTVFNRVLYLSSATEGYASGPIARLVSFKSSKPPREQLIDEVHTLPKPPSRGLARGSRVAPPPLNDVLTQSESRDDLALEDLAGAQRDLQNVSKVVRARLTPKNSFDAECKIAAENVTSPQQITVDLKQNITTGKTTYGSLEQ